MTVTNDLRFAAAALPILSRPLRTATFVRVEILRYTAFSADPAGGNPAGVVLDATGIDDATMARTAADVGFSEMAFVVPRDDGDLDIRYFSPEIEVPFCGHATIATAARRMVSTARRDPADSEHHPSWVRRPRPL